MDRGAKQPTVHGVTKVSDTTERLNNKYKKVVCVCVFLAYKMLYIMDKTISS